MRTSLGNQFLADGFFFAPYITTAFHTELFSFLIVSIHLRPIRPVLMLSLSIPVDIDMIVHPISAAQDSKIMHDILFD
ncbi:hypothetical protein BGZ60DRAFT_514048 [Tricladium varicosporioides]|nr:hypothetical protein BGZ60DRAFT_514048 [Hymenoscyphus varicosporioides]